MRHEGAANKGIPLFEKDHPRRCLRLRHWMRNKSGLQLAPLRCQKPILLWRRAGLTLTMQWISSSSHSSQGKKRFRVTDFSDETWPRRFM